MSKIITIFGTAKAEPEDDAFQAAWQIGMALAKHGFTIANGGYGGTMLAAAKAAAQQGGKTIGVTCSVFKRSSANEYITEEIITDSLQDRLNKLIELGDGYVVLTGGTGTLLELAHVWEMKNKGFASADKLIIILGRFWNPLIDLIAQIDAGSIDCIKIAETPSEAVEILKKWFSSNKVGGQR